jgi:hypothetical protein
MPVGFPTKTTYANGDVFSADDINSTNGTINLLGQSVTTSAAKNAIINGGFDIWQRGTSNVTTLLVYTADRWQKGVNTHFGISRTNVSDTTNLPTIQYAARMQRTSGSSVTSVMDIGYSMESADARRFVGQKVTLSFYARKGANYSGAAGASFNFELYTGTGTDQSIILGYTGSAAALTSSATLTTSMARYSASVTIPTTATEIGLYFNYNPTGTAGANDYVDITGVQLELGETSTTFSRAGGIIEGELAACQRYYVRFGGNSAYNYFGVGMATSTTAASVIVPFPVTMRTAPSSVDFSNLAVGVFAGAPTAITGIALDAAGLSQTALQLTGASGLTQFRTYALLANGTTSNYLAFNAEL